MAGSDLATFVIVAVSIILIINGIVSFYVSGYAVTLQTQARIYTPVRVVYTEFNGSTTNFSAFDEDGLKILTNVTLELTAAGKVVFDGVTDITADKDKYNIIDIDANAEFSHNSIYIDTSSLASLRKSASIFMYNLAFDDPRIMVDGYICPPTICQTIDYTNGTLVFRVTQFSYSYSVEETTEEIPPAPTPGGGGFPQMAVPFSNFTLDKDYIKVALRQGETILDSLEIENTGDTVLNFSLLAENIEDKVALSEDSFIIEPGGKKTVTVAFTIMENGHAEVYTGRLLVEAGGISRPVVLILEVREKMALFDIYVNLDDTPLQVLPGSDVDAQILLYNFGDLKPVDVTLYYSLRDFDGNDLLYKYDTFAVEDQMILRRTIRLPSDIREGFYLFYSRVEYGNHTATSGGLIKVVGSAPLMLPPGFPWVPVLAITVMILILIILILMRRPGKGERLLKKFRTRIGYQRIMDALRPGYERSALGDYDRRVPYDQSREKLRVARLSREAAERVAEERRQERLEAERMAEKEKMERVMLEKRVAEERVVRTAHKGRKGKNRK